MSSIIHVIIQTLCWLQYSIKEVSSGQHFNTQEELVALHSWTGNSELTYQNLNEVIRDRYNSYEAYTSLMCTYIYYICWQCFRRLNLAKQVPPTIKNTLTVYNQLRSQIKGQITHKVFFRCCKVVQKTRSKIELGAQT